jgi:DNA polymerase-3 subunit gamma/tau
VSRTALARTYRPRHFREVATQEHVSETLRAAVQKDRVAQAYLFCGPRGVGKTTLARVLAMALNCPNRGDDGEPCGRCDSCERIWAGRTSLDVVEIDAASNRGVDDARDLRERAMYAPAEDRFKIYIIDEAHMLTREAWNALLKILEEPPPRVIFVFATTEPQKIQQAAPPILSRCQRFDFHRIGTADLVARLRVVLSAEGIEAGDDVLLPIAQKADGGMRDGLSLLDQVLSFTEGTPTAEDVRRVLGLVGTEVYLELFAIVAERRAADVFRFVGRMMDEGYDLAEFYRGLADFLRALLITRLAGGEPESVPQYQRAAVAEAASRFSPGDLLRMLSQVAELDADGRFRKSGEQRILIELLLLRFAYLESTVVLDDVLALLGGAPAGGTSRGNPQGGRPATEPAVRPTPEPARPVVAAEPARHAPATVAPPAEPARPAPAAAAPPAEPARPTPAAAFAPTAEPLRPAPSAVAAPPAEPVRPAPAVVTAPPAEPDRSVPALAVAPPAPPVEQVAPAAPPADSSRASRGIPPWERGAAAAASAAANGRDEMDFEPMELPDQGRGSAPAYDLEPAPLPTEAPTGLDPARVRRAWASLLQEGDGVPAGMSLFLRPARLAVQGSEVRVELPAGSPVMDRLGSAAARRPLEEAMGRRLGGAEVRLAFTIGGAATVEDAGGNRITAESAKRDRLRRLTEGEPTLAAAVQAWDLELVE